MMTNKGRKGEGPQLKNHRKMRRLGIGGTQEEGPYFGCGQRFLKAKGN